MTYGGFRDIRLCRGCRAPNEWRTCFAMDPMPLAGEFSASIDKARNAPLYPLTWVQCERCTLVQVREDVDDGELFGSYHYASSAVPGLVRHFESYADYLLRLAGRSRVRVLEIGCNDGVLLSRLPDSWERVGVDPSDVARNQAAPGYVLIPEPFTSALARDLATDGHFDLVTSSNTLAHLSDLADVLEGVSCVLSPAGMLIIEVHDLDATLAGGQWDTVYHEHKVEWSERSLRRCLSAAGLEVTLVDHLPLHGGLLRVIATRSDGGMVQSTTGLPVEHAALRRLQEMYDGRRRTPLYEELCDRLDNGATLCAYGASGRANVWLNQVPEIAFAFVVDESPLRQGRWLPRIAAPVVAPRRLYEVATDCCVITAWNYAADIRARHSAYQGAWYSTFAN